jgi:hypothetical protein
VLRPVGLLRVSRDGSVSVAAGGVTVFQRCAIPPARLPALLVVLLVMTTNGMRVLQSRVERPDYSHVSVSCQRHVADQTAGDAFRETAGVCER